MSDVITYAIVAEFNVDEERATVVFDCHRESTSRKYFSYDLDFRSLFETGKKFKKQNHKTEAPLEIPFVYLAGSKPFYTNTLDLLHGTKLIFVEPAERDRLYKLIEERAPVFSEPVLLERVDPMRKMRDLWERMSGQLQSCDGLEMTCTSCKITGDSSMKVTFLMRLVHDTDAERESDNEENREAMDMEKN